MLSPKMKQENRHVTTNRCEMPREEFLGTSVMNEVRKANISLDLQREVCGAGGLQAGVCVLRSDLI